MLGGRFCDARQQGFSLLAGRDRCRRSGIDAGRRFTLSSFAVMRRLSMSAGGFSLFAVNLTARV